MYALSMLYMVTFTINIPPMLAYIPYMDPMGNKESEKLTSNDSNINDIIQGRIVINEYKRHLYNNDSSAKVLALVNMSTDGTDHITWNKRSSYSGFLHVATEHRSIKPCQFNHGAYGGFSATHLKKWLQLPGKNRTNASVSRALIWDE